MFIRHDDVVAHMVVAYMLSFRPQRRTITEGGVGDELASTHRPSAGLSNSAQYSTAFDLAGVGVRGTSAR